MAFTRARCKLQDIRNMLLPMHLTESYAVVNDKDKTYVALIQEFPGLRPPQTPSTPPIQPLSIDNPPPPPPDSRTVPDVMADVFSQEEQASLYFTCNLL
jgi:hypothetical protein